MISLVQGYLQAVRQPHIWMPEGLCTGLSGVPYIGQAGVAHMDQAEVAVMDWVALALEAAQEEAHHLLASVSTQKKLASITTQIKPYMVAVIV